MWAKRDRRIGLLPFVVLIACGGFAARGGDLEPVGPPAPTMKTLVQVEPRQFIGNADLPLTIIQPGSYYLLENLVAGGFGEDAITVAVSGVTIDLNGFAISGSEVGIWDRGITVAGEIDSVTVKNGTVRDCAMAGVALDSGVAFNQARNSLVENVHAISNAGIGIRVWENTLILNSVARDNGFDGFRLSGGRIEGSSSWNNGGSGITAVNRSVVNRCTSTGNTQIGIFTSGSTVSGSTVTDNATGIQAGTGKSSIVGNEVHLNSGHGIHVQGGAVTNVRVDGNDVTTNGLSGIKVDGTGNIIIRNVASDNLTNYSIVAGNSVGQILNVAGAVITTDQPWRNLEF